jgi:hypothetical protein
MRCSALVNIAACHVQLKNWKACVAACNQVLKTNSSHSKVRAIAACLRRTMMQRVHLRASARACVRACVRAYVCVRTSVRVHVRACMCTRVGACSLAPWRCCHSSHIVTPGSRCCICTLPHSSAHKCEWFACAS